VIRRRGFLASYHSGSAFCVLCMLQLQPRFGLKEASFLFVLPKFVLGLRYM
jgi:hypothetical protein